MPPGIYEKRLDLRTGSSAGALGHDGASRDYYDVNDDISGASKIMVSKLVSDALLLGNVFDWTGWLPVLGICLAALVGRNLLARSTLLNGNSAWVRFWRSICGLPGEPTIGAPPRDVLEQLRERLPASETNGSEAEPSIVDLLSQIVDVNATLHTRLESAEGTLENQVAEISAYKSEARTDAMTRLANRRVFDEYLRDRLTAWERDGTPVTVLLVDIDHFKKFNDSYGHLAGDEVLKQAAHQLRDSTSDDDLVARIGGEEFGIVIAADNSQSAQAIAERARRAIETSEFEYEGRQLRVTVSIGGADALAAENAAALVKRTDIALYASKAAGRNCVHWHDGQQPIATSQRGGVNPASGFATAGVTALTETKDFGVICHELRQRLVAVASQD